MLVKHNLSTVTPREFPRRLWRSTTYYESEIDGVIFKFRKITNDKTGDAYGITLNAGEVGDFIYIELENLGNIPIRLSIDNSIPVWYKTTVQPKQKIIVCKKLSSTASLRIGPVESTREWHLLKCNAFSVTKGETDVYLPNINTLPEDKQPLLPPEGNYKEIQAL